MNNSTLSCAKCGSTSLYKNGHDKYGNQQFLCKLCHHSFKLSHSHKRKNFPFPYPNALLVIGLRSLCSEESLKNSQW
ncbi:IS1 family transposase [Fervidobacterium sp.]|uniref:IS1/IS1595 family N-terminal zinc-binding domain-containing protein n=1 Tax=Fervidobacterium sp. TaxID=1871331 RepID=UPI003430778B